MAKKIRRPYIINGTQCWISGNTEQEVLDNAIRLMGLTPAPAPAKPKKTFGQYARNWFEKYSKPTVSTATATTYDRQLRLYILPALGDKAVEDITLDDVQGLFNSFGSKAAKTTKEKCKVVLNMIFELAVEEMRCLVEGIGRLNNPIDRAYMALHTLHPLRLEEVLGLRWADVDEENRRCTFSRP